MLNVKQLHIHVPVPKLTVSIIPDLNLKCFVRFMPFKANKRYLVNMLKLLNKLK